MPTVLFMIDSLVDDGALFLDGSDAFQRPLDPYYTAAAASSSPPLLQPRSMSGDPAGVRRLLPQSSQPQTFTFAPNNFAPREAQKSKPPRDGHLTTSELLTVSSRLCLRG